MATTKTEEAPSVIWVMSNRRDDRVVLFEQDSRHPGGEAFVGGSAPDRVFRTAGIEAALRAGTIVEIPEPPATLPGEDGKQVTNRKKPLQLDVDATYERQDQPGQPTRLGRDLDPELVPNADKVKAAQDAQPELVPVEKGTVVPTLSGDKVSGSPA